MYAILACIVEVRHGKEVIKNHVFVKVQFFLFSHREYAKSILLDFTWISKRMDDKICHKWGG